MSSTFQHFIIFYWTHTYFFPLYIEHIWSMREREGRKLPPANFLISSEDGWQLSTDENWMPFWNTPFEVVDHNREQSNWWLYLAAAVFDRTFKNFDWLCALWKKGRKMVKTTNQCQKTVSSSELLYTSIRKLLSCSPNLFSFSATLFCYEDWNVPHSIAADVKTTTL